MADDLEAVLNRSPLTKAQKADLWDAYESAADDSDLAARLEGMQVPKEVKASLWDLKASSSPAEDFGDVEAGSSTGTTRPSPEDQIAEITPQMGYFDTMGELDRAKDAQWSQNIDSSAKGAAVGLSMVVPAMAPARLLGAGMGAQQGYRRGGIPGAVVGAGIGAVKPQAVMLGSGVSDVVEMAGGGTAAGLTAGIASLMLKRYGLGGVGKLLSGVFGSAEKAEAAVVAAAKTAPAAEKLAVARMTKAEAAVALEALPKPSGAAVQAAIPGTRFTPEQAAAAKAAAEARAMLPGRSGNPMEVQTAPTVPIAAPRMPQEAIPPVQTAPMPPVAPAAPAAPVAAHGINPQEVEAVYNTLSEAGLSRGNMIQALKNGPMKDATLPEIGRVVDQLRKGHVVMPAYKGGAGRLAQPSQPGTAPEDLEEMLRQSIAAYRMP